MTHKANNSQYSAGHYLISALNPASSLWHQCEGRIRPATEVCWDAHTGLPIIKTSAFYLSHTSKVSHLSLPFWHARSPLVTAGVAARTKRNHLKPAQVSDDLWARDDVKGTSLVFSVLPTPPPPPPLLWGQKSNGCLWHNGSGDKYTVQGQILDLSFVSRIA